MKKIELLKEQLSFLKSHKGSKQEIANIEKKIEHSKRGRKSKNKGRSYEHEIKDIFNKKFPMLELVRTPASGGFQKASTNEELRGDVSNVNRDYQFLLHIECKNQSKWSLKNWIDQAVSDCPIGKFPSVIFHQQQEIKEGKVVQKAENYICMKLSDFLEVVDDEVLVQEIERRKRKVLKKK